MADEVNSEKPTPSMGDLLGVKTPAPLPPIPEEYVIPIQLVEKWFNIPESDYVNVNLTRRDFDSLFAAIDKNVQAQAIFQQAMTFYTNGNLDEANRKMRDSTIKLTEAHNSLRYLYTSVMASATPK